jgi:hypothetical protein
MRHGMWLERRWRERRLERSGVERWCERRVERRVERRWVPSIDRLLGY